MLTELERCTAEAGLRISYAKTKVIGPVHIDGELLEEVAHFKHLGSMHNASGCSQELRARIGAAKFCITHLSKIWKLSILIRLKQILERNLVWNVATCGLVTWALY